MQEPRLACHAAPAQPQCNTLSDDLACGDMQALLRGHEEPKQVSQAPAKGLGLFSFAVSLSPFLLRLRFILFHGGIVPKWSGPACFQ